MTGPVDRLSAADVVNLAIEAPDTPMHVGALLVLDGHGLFDAEGRLRMADIRSWIDRRLDRAPRLRQVVHRPGPLAGGPLWTGDSGFAIERHVWHIAIGLPGDQDQLLRLTERLMEPLLDRSRPLWQMWFVTGLPDDRVVVLIKLHHAVADGLAAIRLIGSLLDVSTAADAPEAVPWVVNRPPPWRALVRSNLAVKADATVAALRRMRHAAAPRSGARSALPAGLRTLSRSAGAPRTSLNAPIGPHRRLALIRLDLVDVTAAAHGCGATVNDVVLALITAGVGELLSSRGEPVAGVAVHAAVAVSFRPPEQADRAGNQSGVIVARLPLGEPDPRLRLRAISTETLLVKRQQSAPQQQKLMVWLARSGLLRLYTRHQHVTNLIESNVKGPATPIHVLGAQVLDLVPVSVLAGNLALAFLAFSYAGRLSITVCADADLFPDLPVLLAAMERDWATLGGSGATPLSNPAKQGGRQ